MHVDFHLKHVNSLSTFDRDAEALGPDLLAVYGDSLLPVPEDCDGIRSCLPWDHSLQKQEEADHL